jgi:hypothetical protein
MSKCQSFIPLFEKQFILKERNRNDHKLVSCSFDSLVGLAHFQFCFLVLLVCYFVYELFFSPMFCLFILLLDDLVHWFFLAFYLFIWLFSFLLFTDLYLLVVVACRFLFFPLLALFTCWFGCCKFNISNLFLVFR